MSNCYLSQKIDTASTERKHCDGGFSGKTHATSAIAVFLFSAAFLPIITKDLLGTTNVWIIVMAAIACAGASLLPDLDNTSSTSRNSLGPVGHIASEVIRAVSVFIQTTIRSSKDKPDANPHRGAAHTIPACLFFGGMVFFATKISKEITLPVIGETTLGHLFAIITIFVMLHLALSGLFKPFMKDISKSTPLGELMSFVISFIASVGLYLQAPHDQGFWWLGVAIFFGCLIHILGDMFTAAGVPLLWPLKYKGRRWWTFSVIGIKSGGAAESVIFVPFFLFIIVISALKIANLF